MDSMGRGLGLPTPDHAPREIGRRPADPIACPRPLRRRADKLLRSSDDEDVIGLAVGPANCVVKSRGWQGLGHGADKGILLCCATESDFAYR